MSIEAMMWARKVQRVSIADKAVLFVLADHANHAGTCWPSLSTLARETCAARRTVMNALARLERAGWISRARNRDGKTSTAYSLNLTRAPDALGAR